MWPDALVLGRKAIAPDAGLLHHVGIEIHDGRNFRKELGLFSPISYRRSYVYHGSTPYQWPVDVGILKNILYAIWPGSSSPRSDIARVGRENPMTAQTALTQTELAGPMTLRGSGEQAAIYIRQLIFQGELRPG